MSKLTVDITDENLKPYYDSVERNPTDAGFDLFFPEDVTVNFLETKIIDLRVRAKLVSASGENRAFYIYPRSSIAKTPLVLHNCVGIIDSGYRGTLKVAVKNCAQTPSSWKIEKGTRLFQICGPTLENLEITYESLDTTETQRSENGFGSTGQ